jgi:1,4-alpha-glucan branching enzyme
MSESVLAVIAGEAGDPECPRADTDDRHRQQALEALVAAQPVDAFAWLGTHEDPAGQCRLRALLPGAVAVWHRHRDHPQWRPMQACGMPSVFEAPAEPGLQVLRIDWGARIEEVEDAYGFGTLLDERLLARLGEGDPQACREALGAHPVTLGGIPGVRFAVWAPNAKRVAVVGDFNGWDGRRHPMRLRHRAGVWEIFLPRVAAGALYKFEITAADGRRLPHKADPCARQCEHPPRTASVVADDAAFPWQDQAWMAGRGSWAEKPLSIYEVHVGSWRRRVDGSVLDWDALADELIPHVQALGFTHVELLPVTEYPFGGSWGYQPLGIYAPTARHGSPAAFARFVDRCHRAGIGVILDWVSAHFPGDAHGLQRFDGTALYEHEDPREGVHRDWDTLIYNYGRREVAAFLAGSALEWLERFHVDGLRVDAVASMLYRDYSRPEGEWIPNEHGGRENLQAVAFLRQMGSSIRERFPEVMLIAEESTAWPGVTAPVEEGGLGFTHKWNMGWMHDTLQYMQRDPVHRGWHHSQLTFGLVYAFSERFVLPLSHDEVVHGKGSLLAKMPGDHWQRFANLRAYLGLMWAHPGSKLLFMGSESGQAQEWNHDGSLDWDQARQPANEGLARLVGDLNRTLRAQPALHRGERDERSFDWSVANDSHNSVIAFLRHDPRGQGPAVLVASNFTPNVVHGYRVGVPRAGAWRELLNTDSQHYGGSNVGNAGSLHTEALPMHGHPQSLALTLPPLATLYLQVQG